MTEPANTAALPRMRGIKQAIEELRAQDSQTALTEKALRRLIHTGAVPSVRIGAKYLVNLDILYDYLYRGGGGTADVSASAGGIRPVAE